MNLQVARDYKEFNEKLAPKVGDLEKKLKETRRRMAIIKKQLVEIEWMLEGME